MVSFLYIKVIKKLLQLEKKKHELKFNVFQILFFYLPNVLDNNL